MVNPERLTAAGLRAYELGRLRVAAYVALIILPMGLLCAVVTGAGETCLCLATLLLGLSVYLRWRGRGGTRSVGIGLAAGTIPLLAALVVPCALPGCADAPLVSWCTAISLALGLPAGAWIGFKASQSHPVGSGWIAAAAVAMLAASLGCVGLGVAGVVGVGVGLIAGGVSVALWRARVLPIH